MPRMAVMDFELEYSLIGAGDPVVLIHAGVCADWFKPLLSERMLTDNYLVLSYHRVGYGRSSRLEGSVSIADQAKHCSLLMRQLGIERAHIVGHSSSANMALQLALDLPGMVHSLALLEPALYQGVPSASGAARASLPLMVTVRLLPLGEITIRPLAASLPLLLMFKPNGWSSIFVYDRASSLGSPVTGWSFPSNLPIHSLWVGLPFASTPSTATLTLSAYGLVDNC